MVPRISEKRVFARQAAFVEWLVVAIGFVMTLGTTAVAAEAGLPAWEFDSESDMNVWAPNAHLAHVGAKDGILSADAIDWDPFFHNRDISFKASPYQYVLLRVRADRPGMGDLFWSGTLEGKYGGLSENRKVRFNVVGDGAWHEIVLFPFWHTEGTIRQLRLDVYNGAHFDIDFIRLLEWGSGEQQRTGAFSWEFKGGDTSAWQVRPGTRELFAPPCRLQVEQAGWASVQMQSDTNGVAAVLWAVNGEHGMQSQDFMIRGDGKMRDYDIELAGIPSWRDDIVALGVRLPEKGNARLGAVRLNADPSAPAELAVTYLGFENMPNRAGKPCTVLVRVSNLGSRVNGIRELGLQTANGLRIVKEPSRKHGEGIGYDEYEDFIWDVLADSPGEYETRVFFSGKGVPDEAMAVLRFTEPPAVQPVGYVPEPRPVKTDLDVCAYYFPGWNSEAKWDCIRRIAPNRKPTLGYYDEANPECVDWQIKWAAENGISCFLVDWYWIKGAQHLTHWFEAYRKARYRNYLKVAIMWANHNPPGSHSAEDWRNVTQQWIDSYFGLESYYRINSKPAVFIWDPENVRNDLGGADAVRRSLQESQEMARKAGYEGIVFVAMGYDYSSSRLKTLLDEGYVGVTTYHEWGSAEELALAMRRARFDDVVTTAPAAWARNDDAAGALTYYPVADTGWDSRPWHGDRSLVIEGRTPDRFEELLRCAKSFCQARGKNIVVLGPVNEWGEGSYIEPCTEFGFEMIERVRKVFAQGSPETWPVNVAPVDMGSGPYDFPALPNITAWDFDAGPQGWEAMMNVSDLRCVNGALRFRTDTSDPAIVVNLRNVSASLFPSAAVRMRIKVTRPDPAGNTPPAVVGAQLFWSPGGSASSEATSIRFQVAADGEPHTYPLDLAGNSRWRGRISSLRFDPCDIAGAEVAIEEFHLLSKRKD